MSRSRREARAKARGGDPMRTCSEVLSCSIFRSRPEQRRSTAEMEGKPSEGGPRWGHLGRTLRGILGHGGEGEWRAGAIWQETSNHPKCSG